jgi:phage terminase Nu1 subunit (DNA packaging protein)
MMNNTIVSRRTGRRQTYVHHELCVLLLAVQARRVRQFTAHAAVLSNGRAHLTAYELAACWWLLKYVDW